MWADLLSATTSRIEKVWQELPSGTRFQQQFVPQLMSTVPLTRADGPVKLCTPLPCNLAAMLSCGCECAPGEGSTGEGLPAVEHQQEVEPEQTTRRQKQSISIRCTPKRSKPRAAAAAEPTAAEDSLDEPTVAPSGFSIPQHSFVSLVTPQTPIQLVASCEANRCLDISEGHQPHTLKDHDSWTTRLKFQRVRAVSEGPVQLGHQVRLMSEDGCKCLDIDLNGGAYSRDDPKTWATTFFIKPLDGSSEVCYGQPVGLFSTESDVRLDIGCASSAAGHTSWATNFQVKLGEERESSGGAAESNQSCSLSRIGTGSTDDGWVELDFDDCNPRADILWAVAARDMTEGFEAEELFFFADEGDAMACGQTMSEQAEVHCPLICFDFNQSRCTMLTV